MSVVYETPTRFELLGILGSLNQSTRTVSVKHTKKIKFFKSLDYLLLLDVKKLMKKHGLGKEQVSKLVQEYINELKYDINA